MTDRMTPPQHAPSAELQALAIELGTRAVAASWIPTGDAAATVQLRLADHRVVAARRLAGPDALITGERLVRRTDRLHAAGITVAWPAQVCGSSAAGTWLVSPWLDGTNGSDRLADPEGTRDLASSMGSLQLRLAAVDPGGLDLELDWADPERLVDLADAWAREVGPAGDQADLRQTTGVVERFASMGAGDLAWDPVVSHGDLVPVNVIVRPDGSLALLDLLDLQLAPRIFDIAWWGWVVRYHHPAAWADRMADRSWRPPGSNATRTSTRSASRSGACAASSAPPVPRRAPTDRGG